MTTDDNQDPTAVAFAGGLIFACLFFLMINCSDYTSSFDPLQHKTMPVSVARNNGITRIIPLTGLLAVQISAWVVYREDLGQYGFPGYIFPRDIFALPISAVTFVYVAMQIILASGYWMSKADKTEPTQRSEELRLAMYYFDYIYWLTFYAIGGAVTYRAYLYLVANTDNAGSYPANFHVLCAFVLSASIVAIMSLWLHFDNLFLENKIKEKIKVTRFHGFVGVQTIAHEMDVSFMVGTLFYTGAVFALIYKDYYQFSAGAGLVVFLTLLGTYLSKNLGTFAFYHAFALWVVTTVSYVAANIATAYDSQLDPADFVNPGANAGLMQLNISETVTAANFPETLNILTGMTIMGIFSFAASTLHATGQLWFPSGAVAQSSGL
jgi:hypothetical protein